MNVRLPSSLSLAVKLCGPGFLPLQVKSKLQFVEETVGDVMQVDVGLLVL